MLLDALRELVRDDVTDDVVGDGGAVAELGCCPRK